MEKTDYLLFFIFFLLGILTMYTYFYYAYIQYFDDVSVAPGPRGMITARNIFTVESGVLIAHPNVEGGTIDTDSMHPTITEDSTILYVEPNTERDIGIGDIIRFETEEFEYEFNGKVKNYTHVIHRVYAIGLDKDGWYAVTKPDAYPLPDDWRVRFDDITHVVVGIIYTK